MPLFSDGDDPGGRHRHLPPFFHASSPYVVREACDQEGLRALAEPWRGLQEDSSFPSPFASWEWAWGWWHHFGSRREGDNRKRLRVLTVHDRAGLLVAIAPLHCSLPRSPLLPRLWRPLGDDGRDGEDMTEAPVLLLRRGHEAVAARELLRHLLIARASEVGWDFLKLRLPLPLEVGEDGAFPGGISEKGAASWLSGMTSPWLRVRREEGPQVVALPDSWAAFRRSLSRSMRDNLAYYPHRLTRHGHTFNVDLVREPSEVGRATGFLVDLHNRRARSTRGAPHASHIPGEQHAAFLRECLMDLAASGMASVAMLSVDGEVIAAQAFLEAGDPVKGGREMVVYYSGYCPKWYDYSPITILGAAAIEDAIKRGVARLNFLPGQMPWKERWGTHGREGSLDVVCLRPRPGSLARAFLHMVCLEVSALRRNRVPCNRPT